MTRPSIAPASTASDIVDTLSDLGARYDAAPLFPAESMKLLLKAGYHRRFAPSDAGGNIFADERSRFVAIRDALRVVGRGDLSIGRLFEGHVNAMLLFGWYASASQIRWLAERLDEGAWFGVWATEPHPGVRIDQDSPSRLRGAKIFASGAGGLDFALVTAAIDDGHRRLVIAPAGIADRTDASAWRVRGMRASVSGRYDLDDLPATPEMLLGEAGDYDLDPRFTAGAWRFCAVQLGGIEALVVEIRRMMSKTTGNDAVQRARFAEAVVAVRTAGFWVTEAAMRTADDASDAVAIARLTRGVVERAGLDVMEAAARILGTRSAFDGERVDKIIRDLSLYLRQAGPDHARDEAAKSFVDRDCWHEEDRLW